MNQATGSATAEPVGGPRAGTGETPAMLTVRDVARRLNCSTRTVYREYLWRRLLTISAEDCWGVITFEVEALYRSWQMIDRQKRGAGRIFAAKAALLLAQARKCRDADHLTNLVYDASTINTKRLEEALDEVRRLQEAVPDYALDCHTSRGRKAGKTRKDFFREEYRALRPRQKGLFDDDVENLK